MGNTIARPPHARIFVLESIVIRGLQEIEWVIQGIIVADKLVDKGFLQVRCPFDFGMLRDGQIEEATAAAVGWIFVRGLSSGSGDPRRKQSVW